MRASEFNVHSSNYSFIHATYGINTFYLFKIWLDSNYTLIRYKSKLKFLMTCKDHDIIPTHLNNFCNIDFILHHHKSVRRLNGLLYNFKTKAMNIEIFDLHRQIEALHKKLITLTLQLTTIIPYHSWNRIHNHYSLTFHNYQLKSHITHRKKFNWLVNKKFCNYINNIKPIKLQCIMDRDAAQPIGFSRKPFTTTDKTINIHMGANRFIGDTTHPLSSTNEKWFINLSNVTIPSIVSNLLQLGNNFGLPFTNKKEGIHEFIKDIESSGKRNNIKNLTSIRNIAIPQFAHLLNNNQNNDALQRKLFAMEKETLKFCHNNPNIIYTRADKGNVTVALNKSDYVSKVEDLLSDKNTYTTIKKNPCSSIDKELNSLLKSWLNKNYISKNEYFRMCASDSILPKAYGLPKIHKINTPFRIIVSSINTALYALASYIHNILQSSLPKASSHINNSFELYSILSGKTIDNDEIFVSLDVVSLFTNVPIDLALNSINNRWEYIKKQTKLTQDEFLKAIKFILSSTYFTFNNIIYKQTFGTPMGSPLSPIIADLVMQDLEETVFKSMNKKISLYFRYVDDIILTAPANDIDNIVNSFNNYHTRLQFTIERESDRSLNFLDLKIIVNNNRILIDWYQKDMFSGRLLSFFSSHPLCHKIGIIYNLTDRCLLLSHPKFYEKNLTLVIKTLLSNGYPLDLVFDKVNHRIKHLINSNNMLNSRISHCDNNDRSDERKRLLVIPYIKKLSEMVVSSIKKTNKNFNFIVGYRCMNKLNKFIRTHKDKNQQSGNSNVVYKINCGDCDASYVGQTKRQLKTRIKEHKNNIRVESKRLSVISEHIIQENHTFDWDNVKILDVETNYHKRLVSEMLHIKEQKNGLNLNKDTEMLSDSYSDILDRLATFK